MRASNNFTTFKGDHKRCKFHGQCWLFQYDDISYRVWVLLSLHITDLFWSYTTNGPPIQKLVIGKPVIYRPVIGIFGTTQSLGHLEQPSHWDIWNNPVIGAFRTTQPLGHLEQQSLGHLEQPSHHLFAQSQQ